MTPQRDATSGEPAWIAAAMAEALEEARAATHHGDVPIGAVVVRDGELIARGHNERERRGDPTAHAEVIVIARAAGLLGPGGLARCTLVVTLEPCTMCAGAVLASGLGAVAFGAFDQKAGACGSRYNLLADQRLGPTVPWTSGTGAEEAADLLRRFFASRRRSA